jgi:hypothetical protein
VAGELDPEANTIDATSKIIFVIGVSRQPVQITVASGIKGKLDGPVVVNNLDQVRQYLGLPILNPVEHSKNPAASTTSASPSR